MNIQRREHTGLAVEFARQIAMAEDCQISVAELHDSHYHQEDIFGAIALLKAGNIVEVWDDEDLETGFVVEILELDPAVAALCELIEEAERCRS